MTTSTKSERPLETFEAAVKRHRARLQGTGKTKRGLELVAKFMARAEVERGHVAAPER